MEVSAPELTEKELDRLAPSWWSDSYRDPERRALTLLKGKLSPSRWKEFVETREVYCIGNVTGRVYKLDQTGHAYSFDPPKHYCIQATSHVPDTDALLMRILLIENSERDFLNTAIATARTHVPDTRRRSWWCKILNSYRAVNWPAFTLAFVYGIFVGALTDNLAVGVICFGAASLVLSLFL